MTKYVIVLSHNSDLKEVFAYTRFSPSEMPIILRRLYHSSNRIYMRELGKLVNFPDDHFQLCHIEFHHDLSIVDDERIDRILQSVG